MTARRVEMTTGTSALAGALREIERSLAFDDREMVTAMENKIGGIAYKALREHEAGQEDRIERAARAIWAKRPDAGGLGKPWPLETAEQKRAYPHNPVAAVDLCFIYAKAALNA